MAVSMLSARMRMVCATDFAAAVAEVDAEGAIDGDVDEDKIGDDEVDEDKVGDGEP
jgi:hypothetical protein